MTTSEPSSPGGTTLLDPTVLLVLEQDLGDREVVEEVVRVYLALLPERQAAIAEAARREDLTRLRREAHTLASASATIGALALRDVCRELESAPSGSGAADLRALAGTGVLTCTGTAAALEAWLIPASGAASAGEREH